MNEYDVYADRDGLGAADVKNEAPAHHLDTLTQRRVGHVCSENDGGPDNRWGDDTAVAGRHNQTVCLGLGLLVLTDSVLLRVLSDHTRLARLNGLPVNTHTAELHPSQELGSSLMPHARDFEKHGRVR